MIGQKSFIIILCLTFLLAGKEADSAELLFGSKEISYKSFNLFPKWMGMLTRHEIDKEKAKERCVSKTHTACLFKNWYDYLDSLRGLNKLQKLDAVNKYINKHEYLTDLVNWGINDYWETPREFFLKDGDCEDFSIAKFKSLLYLGFSNDDMRIVVLNDNNLQTAHAVLAVYIKGQPYILDNQVNQVVLAKKIKHYTPIYSINETNWWRHG